MNETSSGSPSIELQLNENSRLLKQMSEQLATVVLNVGELHACNKRLESRVDAIEACLDRTDERFDRIDEHFDCIDKRFDCIGKRFERIDERFDCIDKRFEHTDANLEETASNLRFEIGKDIDQLGNRIQDTVNYFLEAVKEGLFQVHKTLVEHAAEIHELKRR